MAHLRFLAIATALALTLTLPCFAQTTNAASTASGKQRDTLPSLDEQMKTLTAKLDLTSDQQAKIKPIMQDLHKVTEKIMHDTSMPREQRLEAVRPHRMEAGTQIRTFLTEEQNKKFDAYLAGPHGEMHGSLTGHPKTQ